MSVPDLKVLSLDLPCVNYSEDLWECDSGIESVHVHVGRCCVTLLRECTAKHHHELVRESL